MEEIVHRRILYRFAYNPIMEYVGHTPEAGPPSDINPEVRREKEAAYFGVFSTDWVPSTEREGSSKRDDGFPSTAGCIKCDGQLESCKWCHQYTGCMRKRVLHSCVPSIISGNELRVCED